MDSSGLGLLITLRTWAGAHESRLRLSNVSHNVVRVLEFSGVTSLFELSTPQLEPD